MGLAVGQRDPLRRRAGEALAPGRYSREALDALRRDVGSLGWNAEYQGAPMAAEGNRFKRAWFEIVDALPAECRRVRYWDKAATAGGGAYTAGVLLGCSGNRYYVANVVRGQWSAGERDRMMRQTAELDGIDVSQWVEQEPGSGGKESAEATVRLLAGFAVYAETVTGDKDTRLEPFAAQCEAGNVSLLRGGWNGAFLDELAALPNGRYRDQSDAAGGAFNKLARTLAGRLLY
jgi:predicted phage terminase large subunit-like protein